jgi:hypothetical protein
MFSQYDTETFKNKKTKNKKKIFYRAKTAENMGPMFLKMYYVYTITLLYMRIAMMSQSVTCRVQIRRSRPGPLS